ncbi:NAD-dependent epimerase/dehydratase family protein [Ferrovum myxofaciens]|uniref:NAD-dependent epimerase/dehydratase family protein n=1 Tax=Ferrovum myxofaciens TaxID=416213 RepID=UPI003EBA6CE2
MNWLITGGCGFLGSSLIRRLLADGGHSIRVIDNLSVGTLADLAKVCEFDEFTRENLLENFTPGRVQFILGDILEEKLAIDVGQGVDVIVHFAANTGVGPSVENPRQDCVTNVIGTLNYLESARLNSIKRFVFASSGAPVGECMPPIHEEMVPHPVSPYGASKLAGEGYCSAYFRTFKVETVALRFGNVYGPGSVHKNSVVAKFIKLALNGETLEIYGNGEQTRDFIYIDDLVRAVYLAAVKSGVGGEIFQIASASETSVGEITKELQSIFTEAGLDNVVARHGEWRVGDVKRNFSDTSKAEKMLDWKPLVPRQVGLKKTFDWFDILVSRI